MQLIEGIEGGMAKAAPRIRGFDIAHPRGRHPRFEKRKMVGERRKTVAVGQVFVQLRSDLVEEGIELGPIVHDYALAASTTGGIHIE